MSSTFTGLQIGKTGLFAAMSGLQVTGNNISNVNSNGYTRQKVDTISLGSYNGTMRYCTDPSNYKGLGVRIMGTTQYRDPSLDVRYRQEAAKLSEKTAAGVGLTEIGMVFDDTINTVLDSQLSDLVTQLQTYANDPSNMVSENLVKSSAEIMTQFFNQHAEQLNTAYSDLTMEFNEAVKDVNDILSRVADLNESIRSAQLGRYEALELQDERNLLLDELSQYMNIEVTPKTVPVGSGYTVETIEVAFVDEMGNEHMLVDDNDYNTISSTTDYGDFTISIEGPLNGTDADGNAISDDITETLFNGAFKGYLDILNGKGTYAADGENNYKGIPFYQKSLDTLANKFATIMNTANGVDKPLFQADGGAAEITAENIQIADSWRNAQEHYLTNTVKDPTNLTDNTNILHMISQINGEQVFETGNGSSFTGSFQDFLTNICTTLGTQIESNDTLANTYSINLDDVDYARESISGVSLDEEAVNMIQYNYALTASSRYLTTVDEALDRLISSTGMVGR